MKDTKNTIINLFSFGTTSILGLLLYFLIVKNGTEMALGYFNIQYIFIVLFSQITTFGVHYSILRGSSNRNSSLTELFNNLTSGIAIVLVNSFIISLIIYIFRDILNDFFNFNLLNIVIPIIFFSINKCFYWFLNGKEKFVKMSFISPFRFIIFLVTYLILVENGVASENLHLCFIYAEILVFILSVIFILKEVKFRFKKSIFSQSLRNHYAFAKNAFLTSFLSDLNLKVDIILIGILLGNQSVGFYTFTSAIGEGFVGLIAAMRTMSTPKFETLTQNKESFDSFKKNIFKLSYLLFIPIGFIILTFSYFFSDSFSFLDNVAENGLFSLFVIVLGFSILSYCFAFEHILLQINYPKEHTKSLLILFASNLALNIVLINIFGINGAAFATIFSYIVYFLQINNRLKQISNVSFLT